MYNESYNDESKYIMKFKSNEDQKVAVYVTHECGDGCRSWEEYETVLVRKDEVFEPEFEYSSGDRTDEDVFYFDVLEGLFSTMDVEAQAWFEKRSSNAFRWNAGS